MVPCLPPREPALGTRLALWGRGGGAPRPIQPGQVQAFCWAAAAVSILPTALPASLDPLPRLRHTPQPHDCQLEPRGPPPLCQAHQVLGWGLPHPGSSLPSLRVPPGVKGKWDSGPALSAARAVRVVACGWESAMGLGFAASGLSSSHQVHHCSPLRSSSGVHCHLSLTEAQTGLMTYCLGAKPGGPRILSTAGRESCLTFTAPQALPAIQALLPVPCWGSVCTPSWL